MATYLVVPDDYAGWNPTGRNFAMVTAAILTVGVLAWMSLHGHLGGLRPGAASDQFFLYWLMWLSVGASGLMAVAVLGSILLSLKARGTVDVTDEGVFRTVKDHTSSLAWAEIRGLVPMSYGGVTLVSATASGNIVIPRFLDDYRGCIAEIKSHGVRAIAPSHLRQKKKMTWQDTASIACFFFFFSLAKSPTESHSVRVASLSAAVACAVWALKCAQTKADEAVPGWTNAIVLLGVLVYACVRIVLTW